MIAIEATAATITIPIIKLLKIFEKYLSDTQRKQQQQQQTASMWVATATCSK